MKSLCQLVPHRYWIFSLVSLAIPAVLILFRGWNGFAYPSAAAAFSDITLSHYTLIDYIRGQLFENHTFPLWFPTILSGTPLVANPLSGLWYPFGWPAFILPLPFTFNLLVGLHLSWGALGMVLFLRQQKLSMAASLFGGLAFGLMPKLFAHYGAGHLTLMYAVPWTPWMLLSTNLEDKYRPLLSAVILALIFLADVRWAVYAGTLWLAWLVAYPEHILSEKAGIKIKYILILIPTAALLTACLALPLLEFSSMSTRASLTSEEIFQYSLTFPGLLGILYPPLQGGVHESILYSGAIVFLLTLVALFQIKENRLVRFWSVVALGALVFSLGSNLPIIEMIAYLPGFNLLRVPTRALFLFGMALAALAAFAIDRAQDLQILAARRWVNLLLTGLIAFVGLITVLIIGFTKPVSVTPFIWGMLAVLASAGVVWLWVNHRIGSTLFIVGVFILLILDAGLVGQTALAYRSKESVWADDEPIAEYLANDPDQFRIYSPSFSLLQHVAGSYHLELAEGVDPLQLAGYVDFMKTATGIPWEGYRVIVPGIAPGESESKDYTPDPEKLGFLNVKYVLADYDLPKMDSLVLKEQIDETRIYKNLEARPRAWVIEGAGGEPIESQVERLNWTPNRIMLTVQGPGLLILSEINYPGWQATINGEQVDIQTDEILRSVSLFDGQNQVEFLFRPMRFYLGVAVSLLTWVVLLAFLFKSRNSLLGN